MLELIALLTLGALAVGAILFVGFLVKVIFKIVLFPVWLVLGLLKVAVGLLLAVFVGLFCLVLAPLALVLLICLGLPILGLMAIFGLGWTLVAA